MSIESLRKLLLSENREDNKIAFYHIGNCRYKQFKEKVYQIVGKHPRYFQEMSDDLRFIPHAISLHTEVYDQ